jgi:hypothetical protein
MYKLTKDKEYKMTNYRSKKTFSSFLPGLAGENGIPMWAFYVNRGQGIASFGIEDKNHAMMEFLPADKSLQLVETNGFRTFIKLQEERGNVFLEPFRTSAITEDDIEENMVISENKLKLEYINSHAGIRMDVTYFILPEEPISGLVRHVTFTNISDKPKTMEMLDGMPAVLPAGINNSAYKELGNTLKSWFDVRFPVPFLSFYTLRGSMEDTAEVKEIREGNYFTSFLSQKGKDEQLELLLDKNLIFGSDTSMQVPEAFIRSGLSELKKQPSSFTNKVSSGFAAWEGVIEPGEKVELFSAAGYAEDINEVKRFFSRPLSKEFMEKKEKRAERITADLLKKVNTSTAEPLFDAYTRQCYLDNGLRGGFPEVFEHGDKKKVYYLYSRKHGDLERDYNFFSISPTYYSQGNGNYRDINQNRRWDVFFEPKIYDANVQQFMNLIQLDGYNPLLVEGVRFEMDDPETFPFHQFAAPEFNERLKHFLKNSYTPGEIKHYIEDEAIPLFTPFKELLSAIMTSSRNVYQARFGEGYWIDHWTYNLDLIEAFLSIYPDKEEEFFFQTPYAFFNSPAFVQPRHKKITKKADKWRQYDAVLESENTGSGQWVRGKYGEGEIVTANLYSKLLLLAGVKVSTLAPYGLGIEMEAGKPGWNDSLNGLPGMIGSSTPEMQELARLTTLLEKHQSQKVALPEESGTFLLQLLEMMEKFDPEDEKSAYSYWDKTAALREKYRETVRHGVSGRQTTLKEEDVLRLLHAMKKRIDQGRESIQNYGVLPPTYFYFEVDNTEETTSGQKIWKPTAVTPFLEGIVKAMKNVSGKEEAKVLYEQVKNSAVYDKKLGMYKTSMPIDAEPMEIGRARSFTPGWLENESVFLHMEYKYLLEVLKADLTEEFYADVRHALIPFLNPETYGRSTLENSSFIASSANPDPALHGRGFVSRLSGSTVEFLDMWIHMMAGRKIFSIKKGDLSFQLSPKLPEWMFTEDNKLSFVLLGNCKVTYLNSSRKNTYGVNHVLPVSYRLIYKSSQEKVINSRALKGEEAEDVRNGLVAEMEVTLE